MNFKAHVVRQPIFDAHQQVIAYELLFHRASGGDTASDREMTAQVIANSLMDIGLDALAGDKPAYINFPREMLLDDTALMLPPERIGIEVLETVAADEALLEKLQRLKDRGFRLVLDDFEYDESKRGLVELADLVKVDVLGNPDIPSTVSALRRFPVDLLAEKVETHEQQEQMRALGFTQFQGYYFCRPQVVEGVRLPESKLAVMRALRQASTADSIDRMFDVIGRDVNLSYKLLRYINSVALGVRVKIESIERALTMLGLENIQRWLTMLSMVMLGEDRSPELVRQTMLRGKLMEDIARLQGRDRLSDYFMLGMFSLLDALLGQSMEVAVQEIVLPEIVRQGLFVPGSNPAHMLTLMKDIERADWRGIAVGCLALGVEMDEVMAAQLGAAMWLEEYSSMLTQD